MTHLKQVRVWEKAHDRLEELASLLAKEKGLTDVTFTDAVSIAILEAIDKREGEKVPELA